MKTLLTTGRLGAFLLTLGVMFYAFGGMFTRAMSVFRAPEEDMSYAWYVPLFSLYVLWTQRAALKEALVSPRARASWTGFLLCLPCCAVALLGTRGMQLRFEQAGFIGLLVAVPWAFFGRRVATFFFFPALYLVFTIPVTSFLSLLTVHLRLLASSTALAVLNGCGIDAVREGTAIISRGAHPFAIDVAEPCSGLRSLFALVALTAAYAWYNQPTWPRRLLLFSAAVPLAVLGNVMRILTICCVAAWCDGDFATGFYHDYSGYIVFIVAIALMVACGEAITRCFGRPKRPAASAAAPEPAGLPRFGILPYFFSLVLAALFVFQSVTPASSVPSPPHWELPPAPEGFTAEEVRYCQREACNRMWCLSELGTATNCPSCLTPVDACSLGERTVLPADTRFKKRLYRGAHGREYLVTAVFGGLSRSSIHRPELCLPAQGYTMSAPHDLMVGTHPFRAISVTPPHGGVLRQLVYTFFNQAGFRTSSHTRRLFQDAWDRSLHNRIDRWVMVTINAYVAGGVRDFDLSQADDREALEAFLASLSKEMP